MSRSNTRDYRQLFLSDTPMLDVRAPVEFNKGAFPRSQNVPLLDDEQRELIGTRYKEKGQDSAIDLGWQLATPDIQQARKDAWLKYVQAHPEGYLYCFRGGLRSRMSQQLIKDTGVDYPFVEGGYKAMRRFLIDELDNSCEDLPLVLISGRTGSGKTLVIKELQRSIDLEGMANHRGSAFGRQVTPQPSQIDFENRLSIALMKQRAKHHHVIFAEDEGKLIGHLQLTPKFLEHMKVSPLAVLETPIEERIDIGIADYVTNALPEYISVYGENTGRERYREQILLNLKRIKKRLGGERYDHLNQCFSDAIDELYRSGNCDAFRPGIQVLLQKYYDPMYDYQLESKRRRIIFNGDFGAVARYLKQSPSPWVDA